MISIIFTAILFFLASNNIYAQSFYAGVNPPILQIETEPPANVLAPISIENLGSQPMEMNILLKPFEPSDQENGQIRYLNSTPKEYNEIFDRIRILDQGNMINSLALGPKQKKDLRLNINIPRETKPFDYYFSVVFVSKESSLSERTSTQNLGGIAVNVLLSTGKEAKGAIQEFSAPLFVEKGPVPFTVRVKNTGNHYFTPQGEIVIKNLLGQTVGKIQLQPVNVLAKSVRLIPSTNESDKSLWEEKFVIGPYIASLNLKISDNAPALERKIAFIAFPGYAILMGILGITTLLYLYSRVKKKI